VLLRALLRALPDRDTQTILSALMDGGHSVPTLPDLTWKSNWRCLFRNSDAGFLHLLLCLAEVGRLKQVQGEAGKSGRMA
jgi:hypothetical protein